MNYLISGASGLIGSHLAKRLKNCGHAVFSLSRNFEIINLNAVDVLTSSPSPIPDHFEALFHCAAAHPSVSTIASDIVSGNIIYTKSMLRQLTHVEIRNIIFCSSIAVYGQFRESEIDVDSPIIKPSLYGRTKLETEKHITEWGLQQNSKIHIVRIPAVIGKNGHKTFLVRLISALTNGELLKINSKKSKFNHAVYIDDLGSYLINLTLNEKEKTLSIVGSSSPLSLGDVVSLLQKRLSFFQSNITETGIESNMINTQSAELLGFKSMKTHDIVMKQAQIMGF